MIGLWVRSSAAGGEIGMFGEPVSIAQWRALNAHGAA